MRRSLRTRSRKRKRVRAPGGKVRLHFRKARAGMPRCGRCGRVLQGVISGGYRSHSEKTVSRIFGGTVCHLCLRKHFINSAAAEWSFS